MTLLISLYRYIFKFILDTIISNSYILYKNYSATTSHKLDFKTFRLQLAQELIGSYNSRQRYRLPAPLYDTTMRKSITPTKRRRSGSETAGAHYPVKDKRGRCWYCWNVKGVRHESSVRCRECMVALCVESRDGDESCFEKYHVLDK